LWLTTDSRCYEQWRPVFARAKDEKSAEIGGKTFNVRVVDGEVRGDGYDRFEVQCPDGAAAYLEAHRGEAVKHAK